MKKVAYAACLSLAAVIMSCNQEGGFKKTELGFEYKMIDHQEESTPLTSGKIVMYDVDYTLEDKIIISTKDSGSGLPISFLYNEEMDKDSVPMLMAIKMCSAGDSVIFKFNAQDLFTDSFNTPLPDSISPESTIYARLKIAEILDREEYQGFMEKKETEIFEKQLVQIDKMLEEEGAEYQKTESGLRYVILQEGEGAMPNPGDSVSVHYTGTLLDGTMFDTSRDDGKPITFPLGMRRVIQGWDEGIALLNKNAKAKFYIPAKLGYGMQGSGGIIPPNSILLFEVELVNF